MIRFNLTMILAERKRDGIRFTYADIAKAIKVHENTVYNMVNNRVKSINLDTLDALCKFFGVGPEKILLWSDGTEPSGAPSHEDTLPT